MSHVFYWTDSRRLREVPTMSIVTNLLKKERKRLEKESKNIFLSISLNML